MPLRIKHLQFPRTVDRPLKEGFKFLGSPALDFSDWTLDEFFRDTSPAMVLVYCKGIGRIKFRKLVRFLLEIDRVKAINWLDQNPDFWDWQTYDIKEHRTFALMEKAL